MMKQRLLTFILAMSTQIVSAQEPSPFYWDFIHVEIDVQQWNRWQHALNPPDNHTYFNSFGVLVTFPHGLLDVPLPKSEGVGFLIVVGLILVIIVWWIKWWCAPKVSSQLDTAPSELKVSDKIGTLPSNLPAPAVSLLLYHRVAPNTVLAMIVEMCQRGSLMMNVRQKGWNKRQFYITKHDTSSVQPWEKRLLDALPNEFEISDLHKIYYQLKSSVDNLAQELGEVLYSRGLFTKNPAPSWSDSSGCLFLAFGSFWLVEPKLMSAGLREINQWRAFKEQMRSTRVFSIAPTTVQFYSYLPYAIALGVADFWFYEGAKAKIPAPVWFRFSGNGDDIPSSIFLDTIEVRQALNSVREAFSGG
jgi:uncharacterized membrane protein (DUF485 family)